MQVRNGFREIHISGGRRGLNIRLPVEALVRLTNARVEMISQRSVKQECDNIRMDVRAPIILSDYPAFSDTPFAGSVICTSNPRGERL